jgi:hypothetical protein
MKNNPTNTKSNNNEVVINNCVFNQINPEFCSGRLALKDSQFCYKHKNSEPLTEEMKKCVAICPGCKGPKYIKKGETNCAKCSDRYKKRNDKNKETRKSLKKKCLYHKNCDAPANNNNYCYNHKDFGEREKSLLNGNILCKNNLMPCSQIVEEERFCDICKNNSAVTNFYDIQNHDDYPNEIICGHCTYTFPEYHFININTGETRSTCARCRAFAHKQDIKKKC